MSNPKPSGSAYDPAKIIRRAIFLVCLLGLAAMFIFFNFRGLSSPRAMEQAQIARELARGNGYTTKVIRPLALWQMEKAGEKTPELENLPDTYHAPLNPLIYAAVFKFSDIGENETWRMPLKSNIYELDRIVAVVCVVFFLISIGINYLLVARIFDTTIATTVALLMLFCELMWSLSQSGLPQMLMLMLFSCAMLFTWRAVENTEENRSALMPILISGVFMSLLVLSHWITLWIFIGYLIFAAVYFRPRGIIAVILIAMLAIFVIPAVYLLYIKHTGSPLGTAYFAIHDGLGMSQDSIMRSLTPAGEDLKLQGLISNVLATTLHQITDLHRNMGAILAAPLFFLSLLHPFKRASLAKFRWLILLMWVFAGLGISIFGIPDNEMDPNQIHILFAPLMAAYGLAMLSILWARLDISQSVHAFRNAHLIIIVAISAGPMLLTIPKDIKLGLMIGDRGGYPHWPPYWPSVYNRTLADNTDPKEIVISDTPWAVAWYADRKSVWLPHDLKQIEVIEEMAKNQQTPISSILITPYSYNEQNFLKAVGSNKAPYYKLYPLVMGASGYRGKTSNLIDTHPDYSSLTQRYPHKQSLYPDGQIMLYSARPVTLSSD